MTTPFKETLSYGRGYWPNQGLSGDERVPNSLIDGKNLWLEGPGRLRSWGGKTDFATFGNQIMLLCGNRIVTMPAGSAASLRNKAIFYIGTAGGQFPNIKVGTTGAGTDLGLVGDALRVSLDGLTPGIAVGLTAPGQPMLSQGTTPSLLMLPGSYSVKISAVRLSTGAESNASERSNVFLTNGQTMMRITLPPAVLGQDAINIYGSKRQFGEDGGWFFLKQVDLSGGIPLFIDLEWTDGILVEGKRAPNDNDLPPRGTHVIALGSVIAIISEDGKISPSKFGKPEAFPPDFTTFLNPAEPVIGIRGRPADGWQYVFCRNSLHALILTGNALAPIRPQAVWNEQGISGPSAAAFVGGEFYGFSAEKLAIRTTAGNQSAEPDSTFALAVETDLELFNPDTAVVGFSQRDDAVVYFGLNALNKPVALVYKRKLGSWCLPFHLEDAGVINPVDSCVSFKGKLIFSAGSAMFEFNGTSSTIPFSAIPIWRDGGAEGTYKTITRVRPAYKTATGKTITTEILTNFENTAKATQSTVGTGTNTVSKWGKHNVKGAITYSLRHKGEGANQVIFPAVVKGGVSDITA